MGDILFLAHRVPFPPNRGDKIRAHHLLHRLTKIAPVHVGCFAENAEDRTSAEAVSAIAASHCIANRSKPLVLAGAEAVVSGKPVSLTAFHSARLEKWVHHTLEARQVDTIVVFSGQMGQYIPDEFEGRVVIDLCDVDSAKFASYAESGERVWLNAREARLLAREEERLGHRADAVTLITASEAAMYRANLRRPDPVSIHAIGNGIDADSFDPAQAPPRPEIAARPGPHFVFTGQMDYRPNEQAALWAIGAFLPAVRTVHASAELHVVGRSPTPELLAQSATAGVTVWGEVPYIRPFIAAADCVIAPLLIARGVQNKVLEAMAMARPVLLTPEAATGIAASDGEEWLVAPADPAAMMAKLEPILRDESRKAAMGDAARRFVLENHAWDAMLEPFEGLVRGETIEARDAA